MHELKHRLAIMIVIILVIGLLGLLARQVASLEWLIENESRMRDFIRDFPLQSWLLGLAVYTAFSLVPGTTGKSVIWGWVFGFWPAVVMVDIGLTTAAVVSFLLSRFLLRDSLTSRFRRFAGVLEHDEGAFYLLLIRLAHVPFTLVNYGAGATSIRLATFYWTTMLGLLPGTMVFVFVGTRIPTLESLARNGPLQLLDPLLVAILAATVIFPILIRWSIRKSVRRSGGSCAKPVESPSE